MQRCIQAAAVQQIIVTSHLHDPALVEHDDSIGVFDRREPMGDDQGGAALHQKRQLLLNPPLRFIVERRGRLVENQHRRVLEQRARNGYSLPLAARKILPAIAEHRVEALGLLIDKFHDVCGA